MYADAILILLVSCIASVIGEGTYSWEKFIASPFASSICRLHFRRFLGLTWILVYRTDRYKKLKAEIDRQVKKGAACSSSGVCFFLHWDRFDNSIDFVKTSKFFF